MQNCCLLLLLLHFSPLTYTPFPPSGNTPAQSCFEVFVSDLDLVCKSHLSLSLSLFLVARPGWATCCVGIGLGIGGSSSTTHPNAWELRRPCFEVAWKRLFAEFQMRKNTVNTWVCVQCCCCLFFGGKKLNKSVCKSYVHIRVASYLSQIKKDWLRWKNG